MSASDAQHKDTNQHANKSAADDKTENGELFSLKTLFVILAIYSYFTGWIYAYYFLRHFGITINSVEIPLQHFYVYSYSVFATFQGLIALILALAVGYTLARLPFRRWLTIPVLLIAVPGCFWLAQTEADARARGIRQGYDSNTIRFYFKKDTRRLYPKELLGANEQGVLRLITQTKDRYFVVWQPRAESTEPELPYAYVYHVSKDDIVLAAVDIQQIKK